MKQLNKSIKFLDTMVRVVFISTFAFTIIMGLFAWLNHWEQLAIVLTERWFNIMVGELVVMGAIQIVKEVIQGYVRKVEMQFMNELDKDKNQ